MAFTLWHPDAVSGSHPPHLLSGAKRKSDFRAVRAAFDPELTYSGYRWLSGRLAFRIKTRDRRPALFHAKMSFAFQSVNTISNRFGPVDLLLKLTVLPERAANVPDANLNTVFPENSVPTILPSFMMTDPVPSRT